MNRRMMFIVMTAFALCMIAGARDLRAQCSPACSFNVTFCNFIPANCLPITVKTEWTDGISTVTQNNTVNANGTTNFSQPSLCPPEMTLNRVSIDGGATWATLGGASIQVLLPCGVTVCLTAIIDVNGCVRIRICTPPCP